MHVALSIYTLGILSPETIHSQIQPVCVRPNMRQTQNKNPRFEMRLIANSAFL